MKISIVQKSSDIIRNAGENACCLWQLDIPEEEYKKFCEKHQDEGYSSRGAKQEVLEELSSLI